MNVCFGREIFEFNLGQKINILSDKAFRKSSQNEFEAIGNVVITHFKNSIYGEKARINFATGDAEIIGNVRFVAPNVTLYGTSLRYNFLTKQIDIDNARVLSDNFVVTGKKILQSKDNTIYAEDAEYTTCKDCPESWSIFGKKVKITLGEYIKIKHAYIKINGVVAMYFPYVVFPIKQKRESGILFPSLGLSSKDGFRYQQPFFWSMSDSRDSTITPSTYGNRGLGGELQYRQTFKEKTWLEFNSMLLSDKLYDPQFSTVARPKEKYLRHFSDLEFHLIQNQDFNSHFYYTNSSDLDTLRDLDFFTNDKTRGAELGGGGFFEMRKSFFSFVSEAYFNRNLFFADPREFDDHYVQILPKLSLSTTPYNLFHSDYFFARSLSLGLDSDYTIFKQNKMNDAGLIRNAQRLNLAPYMKWQIGNIGPVFLSNYIKLDYQNYHFPDKLDNQFTKKGLIYETEAKIEVDKIFGVAYLEEKQATDFRLLDSTLKQNFDEVIGSLPDPQNLDENKTVNVLSNSYRHSQEFKIKHYYLSDQKLSGNQKFKTQIEDDNGQFDYIDAIRAKEHLNNQVTALDSLPLSNTFEFQWNNRLIRKKAKIFDPFMDGKYLKDNFIYENVGFFDLSQGIDVNSNSQKLVEKLTRLYLNSGISIDQLNFNIQEFYFHRTSEHKLTSSLTYNFDHAIFGSKFTYNSFNSSNTPVAKLFGYTISLSPNDLITFKNGIDYNLQTKKIAQSNYSLLFSPRNNCWKIDLNYSQDLIDKKFGVLFYLNYNENNFSSLNAK